MADLPEHVATNRAFWDGLAAEYVDSGRRNWESEEPTWGIFAVPESEVGVLPAAIDGRDSIELGCGTGYVSAWLARRGARPVGIDNSAEQLETARALPQRVRDRVPAPARQRRAGAPTPTPASTWRSPSTGRASGATPTPGSPRRPACCAPAASSSSSSTRSSLMLCGPDDETIPAGDRLLRPLLRHAPGRVARRGLGRIPPAATAR